MAKKGVCDYNDPPVICEEGGYCDACYEPCEGDMCAWWAQDYDGEDEIGEPYE